MKIVLPLLVLLCAAPVFAVPLSVTVVDTKGKPVPGADVQFESFGKSPRGFVLQQTNAQGTTTFEVEPLPRAPYGDFAGRIFAHKNGLALGDGELHFKKPSLQLELGASAKISGKIVDPDGKPITGVNVSFLSAEKDGHENMLVEGPLLPQMTARSGADGKWQLDGIPADSKIWLTVSAPDWVTMRSQIQSGGTSEIVMAPGAQMKGRLLGLDGKPLAGIYVSAEGTNTNRDSRGGSTKTAEDGTYTLDGLSAGTFNVTFNPADEEHTFVIGSIAGVKASIGAPLQLPDARAVEGVLISGHVSDSATKAPLPNVYIGVYGGVNPATSSAVAFTTTDDKGAWKMRTLPGENKIYLSSPPVGYKQEQQEKNLTIGEKGGDNLDFTLDPLPKITGRVLDENGKGIKTSIQLRHDNDMFWGASDDNGDLTAYGPTGGDWNLTITEGDWEVVGPARITINADKPLEVRLKRPKLATLEVGVYDEDDAAIEGAHVTVNISSGEGDDGMMQPRELITDKLGRAHIDNLRQNSKVEIAAAKKEGYDTPALPKADHVGQVWSAALTLSRRTGRATGQIFGENGEFAANTRISGSGIDARSDATGHFDLAPLPKGVTPVFAYRDTTFALASSDKTRLDLKPQSLEPTDPKKAGAILAALSEQAKDVEYYGRESLAFEVGSFDELAAKLKQTSAKRGVATLISRFGMDRTIPAARWFEVLRTEKTATQRLYSTSLWLKTAPTIAADDDSRRFLQSLTQDVTEAEPLFTSDDKWMIGHGIFAASAIAEKIGDTKAADDLFDRARTFTEKSYKGESDRDYGVIGDIIAASPRLLLKAAALLPDTNGNRALMLGAASPVLARTAGLDAVKPFLTQLQTAPPPKPDSYGDTWSTESQWYEAVVKSIRAAGKSNTALALELAKSLPTSKPGYADYDAYDTALCEAAFFQTPEVAHELWSDALPRLSPDKAMSFVARILSRDADFARAQYENLARDVDARPLPEYNANYWQPTVNIAAFVFYESRFNPARARFRVERALANARSYSGYMANEATSSLAKAMAIFDADRAVGLTSALTGGVNDWSGNFSTRRRIAQWLSLSEEARKRTSFSGNHSQDWDFSAP